MPDHGSSLPEREPGSRRATTEHRSTGRRRKPRRSQSEQAPVTETAPDPSDEDTSDDAVLGENAATTPPAEEPAADDTADGASSDHDGLDDSEPDDNASGDNASGDNASGDNASGDNASDDDVSDEAAPGASAPEETRDPRATIDPLSVAASGFVDVSDVESGSRRGLGRLRGRQQQHQPDDGGDPAENDPLAILRAAIDAGPVPASDDTHRWFGRQSGADVPVAGTPTAEAVRAA